METLFAFGRTGLKLTLPAGPRYQTLRGHSAGALPGVDAALEAALDAPIGSPSLAELAAGKKTAAISVCDITRPVPNRITLPPILSRLHAAGMRAQYITLCIATGLHRKATGPELDIILGPEIAARYPILNHDAKDLAAHRFLGETRRGTPIYIEKPFLDADLRLSLGFIEQHLMLGFSGGRKLVAPGLAAQQTIKVIHSPRFMREALATEGSTEDNPLHAELLEIAHTAGHNFILDVTLTQSREISGIFAGDPVRAHSTGVEFLRQSSVQLIDDFADAAITSAAGYPLDLTLYQAIKGISAAQHIVKPGGTILVVAECAEGIGSPEFASMLKALEDPAAFLEAIKDSPVVPDQWQLEKLALIALKYRILFYAPGTNPAQLGCFGAASYTTIDEAVARLLSSLRPNASIAVLPDGPYAYARVAATA